MVKIKKDKSSDYVGVIFFFDNLLLNFRINILLCEVYRSFRDSSTKI